VVWRGGENKEPWGRNSMQWLIFISCFTRSWDWKMPGLGWVVQSLIKQEFWCQFCNVLVHLSGYIICPSVLSLNKFKLHKAKAVKNICTEEKIILQLTFNPGIRITQPWCSHKGDLGHDLRQIMERIIWGNWGTWWGHRRRLKGWELYSWYKWNFQGGENMEKKETFASLHDILQCKSTKSWE